MVRCPKCGSPNVSMATLDGIRPIEEYKMWICQNCYTEFNEGDEEE
jgi:transcription elongation factor Elf1